jgi:uncharacterized protein involved in response to NO
MLIELPLKGEKLAPNYGPWWRADGVLWATGFRPFFLLGPALTLALLPWWAAVLAGAVKAPTSFDPISWHAHEMLFGYAVAIIAGFLLTAVPKWTSSPPVGSGVLAGLTVLWLAGRAVMNVPGGVSPLLVGAVDVAFLPALAWVVGRPIVTSRSRHNYPFVGLLALAALANLALHLRAAGFVSIPPRGLSIAVDFATLVMVLVGGRIIPQFTGNRLRLDTRRSPRWAKASLALCWALLVADVVGIDPSLVRWLALAAGVALLIRARGWGSWQSRAVPMLWVLHVGFGWIAVSLILRGLVGQVPGLVPSLATHAMTAGAVGTLTLGMMARVSLGHTGRMIEATRPIALAFALIVGAAALRVLGPLAWPTAIVPLHAVTAGLWSAAMVLYLVRYAPILTSPRVDGKAG